MGCGCSTIEEAIKKKIFKKNKINSLVIDKINFSALNVNEYFRNQKPYSGEQLYVDDIFPPNDNSIFGLNKDGSIYDSNKNRYKESMADFGFKKGDIIWRTAREIFGEKYTIFEGGISMNDVNQGGIGNCYLLATIAALCEIPELIVGLFRTLKVTKNGYYEVVLNINGVWQVVTLDEYFPCDKNSKQFVFCTPKGPELWTMLLEKAWAKVNGGYVNTINGFPGEVMNSFTNFNIKYIDFEKIDKEILWEKILHASKTEEIMACNIDSGGNKRSLKQVNLTPGHVYTIVNGYENNGLKLVQFRNPWGTSDYKGSYNDDDDFWKNEENVKKFNFKPLKNEGFFFVNYDDIPKYFAIGQICLVENPLASQIFKINNIGKNINGKVYNFKIKENNTHMNISVNRPTFRFNRNLPEDYQLPMNVLVTKKNSSNCEELLKDGTKNIKCFDDSWFSSSYEENIMFDLNLDQGDYLIYISVDIESSVLKQNISVVVNLSANELFDFEDIGLEDNDYSLLNKIFSDLVEVKNFKHEDRDNIRIVKNESFLKSEFSILYFKNQGEKKSITFEINSQNHKALNFTINSKNKITLDKNETFVAIMSLKDYYGELQFEYTFDLDSNEGTVITQNKKLNNAFISIPTEKIDVVAEYEWIYKKLDNFNINSIYETIDSRNELEKKFIKLYPSEMEKILKIPKLDDGIVVNFQDINKNERNEEYLGEWDVNDNSDDLPHGRGMLKLTNGKVYYGQFKNGEMTGFGSLDIGNGEKVEGMFRNGKLIDKGVYFMNDGRTKEINSGFDKL